MSKRAKATISIVMIGVTLIACGWAMMDLWSWFVAPFGLPEIRFWHALGLAVFINTIKTSTNYDDFKASTDNPGDDTRWAYRTFGGPFKWLFGWGAGGLISLAMP